MHDHKTDAEQKAIAQALLAQLGDGTPSAQRIESSCRAGEWELAMMEAIDDVLDGYGSVETGLVQQAIDSWSPDLRSLAVTDELRNWLAERLVTA